MSKTASIAETNASEGTSGGRHHCFSNHGLSRFFLEPGGWLHEKYSKNVGGLPFSQLTNEASISQSLLEAPSRLKRSDVLLFRHQTFPGPRRDTGVSGSRQHQDPETQRFDGFSESFGGKLQSLLVSPDRYKRDQTPRHRLSATPAHA